MAQNIYDNAEFFGNYSQLPRQVLGLDGAPEWPAMRALLPDAREMKGKRVVDLGCGFGWFCRWAREAGAAEVLGLDVSENMLGRAREWEQRNKGAGGTITYLRADLEEVDLPPAAFDLAYSSLALHYVVDLAKLMAKVHRGLVPGGHLVFSVEHPIYMAPSRAEWMTLEDGRKVWPVDRYLEEGPRTTDWLAKGVVKQYRNIGTHLNLLIRLGFVIEHVEEWGPTPQQVAEHPEWAVERDRPPFLLVRARR